MSSIVQNQKRAFLARSMDAARRLQDELVNLSDAQRAAILAIIAAKTSTPVDIVMLTSEPGDWNEARQTCGDELKATPDRRWSLGNGCEFIVEEMLR
jgi:hypothetical protein